jgi:hypothetical protein
MSRYGVADFKKWLGAPRLTRRTELLLLLQCALQVAQWLQMQDGRRLHMKPLCCMLSSASFIHVFSPVWKRTQALFIYAIQIFYKSNGSMYVEQQAVVEALSPLFLIVVGTLYAGEVFNCRHTRTHTHTGGGPCGSHARFWSDQ